MAEITFEEIDLEDFGTPDTQEDRKRCQCGEIMDEDDIVCTDCQIRVMGYWIKYFTDDDRRYIAERVIN